MRWPLRRRRPKSPEPRPAVDLSAVPRPEWPRLPPLQPTVRLRPPTLTPTLRLPELAGTRPLFQPRHRNRPLPLAVPPGRVTGLAVARPTVDGVPTAAAPEPPPPPVAGDSRPPTRKPVVERPFVERPVLTVAVDSYVGEPLPAARQHLDLEGERRHARFQEMLNDPSVQANPSLLLDSSMLSSLLDDPDTGNQPAEEAENEPAKPLVRRANLADSRRLGLREQLRRGCAPPTAGDDAQPLEPADNGSDEPGYGRTSPADETYLREYTENAPTPELDAPVPGREPEVAADEPDGLTPLIHRPEIAPPQAPTHLPDPGAPAQTEPDGPPPLTHQQETAPPEAPIHRPDPTTPAHAETPDDMAFRGTDWTRRPGLGAPIRPPAIRHGRTPPAQDADSTPEPYRVEPPLVHRPVETRVPNEPPAAERLRGIPPPTRTRPGTAGPSPTTPSQSTVDIGSTAGSPPASPVYRAALAVLPARRDTQLAIDPVDEAETISLPVPPDLTDTFRTAFGVRVEAIPIHRGPAVSRYATALEARAFTHRGEVFLPDEAGALDKDDTKALLAHELVHATQQRVLGPALPLETSSEGRQLEEAAIAAERWFRGEGTAPQSLVHRPPSPEATAAVQAAEYAKQISEDLDELRDTSAADSLQRADDPAGPVPGDIKKLIDSEFLEWSADTPATDSPLAHEPGATEIVSAVGGQTAMADVDDGSLDDVLAAIRQGLAGQVPLQQSDGTGIREALDRLTATLAEPRAKAAALVPVDLDDPTTLDDLASRLYAPLRTRLRQELIVDRERSGTLADWR